MDKKHQKVQNEIADSSILYPERCHQHYSLSVILQDYFEICREYHTTHQHQQNSKQQ